jgi:CubicO group peptidase (beta-lactamase class C family)
MATLVGRLRAIHETLDALARRHRVPGATLAIAQGDELLDFATGVLNVNTGVETTTDSLFQIGSNTKLFTATLIMQLVDAGEVELDQPVRRYLPSFSLADPTAAEEITVRHLLTHTSGIQGDHFLGFGRGEEAIGRYVDSLAEIDLVHRPGQLWSYCNSGFVVAGRVAEVVTNTPYHQLLKERICGPLGLTHTTVLADEMLAHRVAVGHVAGPAEQPTVPPVVVMEYAQVPAGSRTTSTAAELVRFAQMHLRGGRGPDANQVLSEGSVAAMREAQVDRPAISTAPLNQGLGWLMAQWDGHEVVGHGGGTIGQLSFLEVLPDRELVVALLTNSGTGGLLWRDLGRWLFEELAGVEMPGPLKPSDSLPPLSLERYVGIYERLGVRHQVAFQEGELVIHTEVSGPIAELRQGVQPPPARLRPIDAERFATTLYGEDATVAFLEFVRGRPRYLFIGRVARRTRTRRAR